MEDPLPDDAVQMLTRLATRDDDPTVELWGEGTGGGQPHGGGDVHARGINTTRGRAADAIRDLILTNAAYIERFRPALDQMVRDPSAAVRSCVGGALRAVTFHEPALGRSLFQNMDLSEDRLLVTPHVYGVLHTGLRDRFDVLRSFVERMLRSSEPEVREAGSRAGVHLRPASQRTPQTLRTRPCIAVTPGAVSGSLRWPLPTSPRPNTGSGANPGSLRYSTTRTPTYGAKRRPLSTTSPTKSWVPAEHSSSRSATAGRSRKRPSAS